MSTAAAPPVRQLDPATVRELREAAQTLLAEFGTSATSPELLAGIRRSADRAGRALRHHCRPVDTADGLFLLRGLDVDDATLGPTPTSWATAQDSATLHDLVLLLLATLMGRPLAWEGQQGGRFVHDIVPSPGHEHAQTGASSTVLLSPHTEDAFHPGRAHLLVLGCLRNHDDIATTAASIRRTRLADADVRLLTEPVLPIFPDDAYGTARSYADRPPPPVPALFAAEDGPTLRYDPAYTPLDDADEEYRAAYGRLSAELARVSVAVRLRPGEVLVVDNDLVVHGRAPFRARYDGTDRWLKRASVRVPGRRTRPAAEAGEHGYGQTVLEAPAG
ncbi:TauD/TfdA family dioxygenase [Streptomyces sp. WAC06614]|uniref:TauD/TfdA family dioxygenase n=1 Tax=Streptomyces sp. WAC06614 TaxID=2487416 RepID=UPI000F789E48|nr:TauD/TfdA family dioxygenase [Streptomyces sp. WAC06614]RSS58161.1 oxygenase [Streptomyces sp. WAC06614]